MILENLPILCGFTIVSDMKRKVQVLKSLSIAK